MDAEQSVAMTSADQMTTVDVVIPVRNRPHLVVTCLDSVRAQSLQPNLVVVVDDGSNDETQTILSAYAADWPKLRVIRTQPRGPAHARNVGVAASEASFVAFLDSDDVWQPKKLERQMKLFAGRPEIGLVHCACVEIDERGDRLPGKTIFVQSKRGDVFNDMINRFYHVTLSSAVVRRKLFSKIGGFDERMLHVEDADLFLQIARETEVDYIAEALVGLRSHPGNAHAHALKMDREFVFLQKLRVWSKWLPHLNNDAVLPVFRREALAIVVQKALWQRPDLGMLRRLRESDVPLARLLFPNLWSFLHCLTLEADAIGRRIANRLASPAMIFDRLKFFVARKAIMRSHVLLRICKRFGKFQGVDGPIGRTARGLEEDAAE